MIYMTGDYSSSDSRYGTTKSGCFAFVENTIRDGDIFVSTIGVYSDKEKTKTVFVFNVGTITEDIENIMDCAIETYLDGFIKNYA
ncbi:hypothetical protein RCIP0012_00203 [Klebsiella phage RCIP0012]